MIVFQTNMKELPKSCKDCELYLNTCKLSFKMTRYKIKKYCPLLEIPVINNLDKNIDFHKNK